MTLRRPDGLRQGQTCQSCDWVQPGPDVGDDGTVGTDRPTMLSSLFPLLYGAAFVALLWQAFRVMGKGFQAASGPLNDRPSSRDEDRTGQVTVHPELLDPDGRITEEDLLTVRFSNDDESLPPGSGTGTE